MSTLTMDQKAIRVNLLQSQGDLFINNKGLNIKLTVQWDLLVGNLSGTYHPESNEITISAHGIDFLSHVRDFHHMSVFEAILCHEIGHALDPKIKRRGERRKYHALKLQEAIDVSYLKSYYHLVRTYYYSKVTENAANKVGKSLVSVQSLAAFVSICEEDYVTPLIIQTAERMKAASLERIRESVTK